MKENNIPFSFIVSVDSVSWDFNRKRDSSLKAELATKGFKKQAKQLPQKWPEQLVLLWV